MLGAHFRTWLRGLWFVLVSLVLVACSDNTPTRPTPTRATADAGATTTTNPTGSGATLAKTIGTSGGQIAVGNLSLDVPAGAVPSDTTITVTEAVAPAAPSEKAVTPVYVFGPEGLKFNAPVNVTIAYHGDPKNLTMYWSLLGDATKFEPIGTKFTSAGAVAAVTHFSSGFIGELPAGQDSSQCDAAAACPTTPPSGACDSLCIFAPCDYDAQLCACQGSTWVCTDKTPTPPTPVTVSASPAAGTFPGPIDVSLTASAPAAIQYTLDGSDPVAAGSTYGGPIHVATTTTIKAVALPGGTVSSFTYTIAPAPPAAPTFTPAPGTFNGSVDVSLASADGAAVYYTTNGVDPTAATGTLYTAPIHLTDNATIRAIASASGVASTVVSGAYTIVPLPTASAPTLTPAPGTYTAATDVSLATTSPSATIYYTLDGTAPTTASAIYTGAITIGTTTTLRAIAGGTGYTPSGIVGGDYTINIPPTVVAAPTLTPGPGTFNVATGVDVTLATQTAGAAIHFTVDGTTPTGASTTYSAPVHLAGNTTLKAIATKAGSTDSSVVSGTYQFSTPAPAIQPNGGTFQGSVSVSLAAAAGSIFYTTDGSAPTTASLLYAGPFPVTTSTVVQAFAQAANALPSSNVSAAFTITQQQTVATPTFTPGSGTYTNALNVGLSTTTPGASIYYTLDGSAPTPQTGTLYNAVTPISITTTTTIRAIGAMQGATTSAIAQATYTIKPAAPSVSVASGSYDRPQTVTLSTTTINATIRYTVDGSAPTAQSPTYTAPIAINSSTTLRAIAVSSDNQVSSETDATYSIYVAAPTTSPAGGTYPAAFQVTLQSTTPNASIYYTLDGTAPTAQTGTLYTGAISITGNTTLRAIAVSGAQTSMETSASYVIQ